MASNNKFDVGVLEGWDGHLLENRKEELENR
jgi:hypothetical protein